MASMTEKQESGHLLSVFVHDLGGYDRKLNSRNTSEALTATCWCLLGKLGRETLTPSSRVCTCDLLGLAAVLPSFPLSQNLICLALGIVPCMCPSTPYHILVPLHIWELSMFPVRICGDLKYFHMT